MRHILFLICFVLALGVFASPALACSPPLPIYFHGSDRESVDGSFGLTFDSEGQPTISTEVQDAQGVVIPGALTLIYADQGDRHHLIWEPDSPMALGVYSVKASIAEETGADDQFELTVVDSLVTFAKVDVEFQWIERFVKECCSIDESNCVEDCGYPWTPCDACWITSSAFAPVVDIYYEAPRQGLLVSPVVDTDAIVSTSPATGGVVRAEMPSDTTFPFCVRLVLTDKVGSVVEQTDEECFGLSDFEIQPFLTRPESRPDHCLSDQTPDMGDQPDMGLDMQDDLGSDVDSGSDPRAPGSDDSEGCCATVHTGSNSTTILLLIIGLVGVVLRRTRQT